MSRRLRSWALATVAGAVMLFGVSGVAQAVPAYYPSGPQTNVPKTALTGWTQCYSANYDTSGPSVASILAGCPGDYLLFAGAPVGGANFDVLAAAPRADATFATSPNTTHQANGSGWYFSENRSWGFAPGGSSVNGGPCDASDSATFPGFGGVSDGDQRLCWHTGDLAGCTSGNICNGWRSGRNDFLQDGVQTHERFIYAASDVSDPCASPTQSGAGVINGTGGDDVIAGSAGVDTINGNGGNDVICGRGGNDKLYGAGGTDQLYGEGGADKLYGRGGNDALDGGAGNDYMLGEAGDDTNSGGDGADQISAAAGNDTINGDAGNDLLAGATGSDTVNGGDGDDSLNGGAGIDTCDGGAGTDTDNGGAPPAAATCETSVGIP